MFTKGVSGNPKGRPVGTTTFRTQIQEAFLAEMKKPVEGGKPGQLFFNTFNEVFMASALDPRSQAFRFLADRLYSEDILKDIDAQVNKQRREDRDFLSYRLHRMAFDIQQRILLSSARDIGLMAGRRAGKTAVNSLKAVDVAASEPHARVLIIGLTITKTEDLYREQIQTIIASLGIEAKYDASSSILTLDNGAIIQFGGNANKPEREKYRGHHWDLVIIDEAQSQPDLRYLVEDVVEPMLIDTNGQLILSGSGPKTRGTYWEYFYNNPRPSGLRLNWDLTLNPHIANHETAIAEFCEARGLTPDDPMVLRELRGLVVYDDDALVYRTKDANYFTWDELEAWMKSQAPDDIRFVGGLDFGKTDSDALVVVCYSQKRNEKFVVYEYKKSGTGFVELTEAIKAARAFISNDSRFRHAYRRNFDIYADTNEAKFIVDANMHYNLNLIPAYKQDKAMGIQMMQDEVRSTRLKILKDGEIDQEMLRTIFKRIEYENQPSVLTREIDDEVFHPDALDALLYAMRTYFLTHGTDHYGSSERAEPGPSMTPTGPTEDWEKIQQLLAQRKVVDDQLS